MTPPQAFSSQFKNTYFVEHPRTTAFGEQVEESDFRFQNECQRMATSDNEWKQVIQWMKTSDSEWQRMAEGEPVKRANESNESEWEPEAVAGRCSVKKVFLKTFRNS